MRSWRQDRPGAESLTDSCHQCIFAVLWISVEHGVGKVMIVTFREKFDRARVIEEAWFLHMQVVLRITLENAHLYHGARDIRDKPVLDKS